MPHTSRRKRKQDRIEQRTGKRLALSVDNHLRSELNLPTDPRLVQPAPLSVESCSSLILGLNRPEDNSDNTAATEAARESIWKKQWIEPDGTTWEFYEGDWWYWKPDEGNPNQSGGHAGDGWIKYSCPIWTSSSSTSVLVDGASEPPIFTGAPTD